MMEKPLYFAYGSNINLDQMRYRCPDATVYGQAVLDNYDLRFRGSGVATVEPKEGACVYGLLWELSRKGFGSGVRSCSHGSLSPPESRVRKMTPWGEQPSASFL